jgi:hypothetical protein
MNRFFVGVKQAWAPAESIPRKEKLWEYDTRGHHRKIPRPPPPSSCTDYLIQGSIIYQEGTTSFGMVHHDVIVVVQLSFYCPSLRLRRRRLPRSWEWRDVGSCPLSWHFNQILLHHCNCVTVRNVMLRSMMNDWWWVLSTSIPRIPREVLGGFQRLVVQDSWVRSHFCLVFTYHMLEEVIFPECPSLVTPWYDSIGLFGKRLYVSEI